MITPPTSKMSVKEISPEDKKRYLKQLLTWTRAGPHITDADIIALCKQREEGDTEEVLLARENRAKMRKERKELESAKAVEGTVLKEMNVMPSSISAEDNTDESMPALAPIQDSSDDESMPGLVPAYNHSDESMPAPTNM